MKGAFTLIELLVVTAIIAVLSTVILAAVLGVRGGNDQLQTREMIGHVQKALLVYQLNEDSFPAADNGYYVELDSSLDEGDLKNLKDFQSWPILNKLRFKAGLSVDSQFIDSTHSTHRLVDAWSQDIRYVLNDALDDNGRQAQGAFASWNWNASTSQAIRKPFAYVYSYGADNETGEQMDLWIFDDAQGAGK